MIPGNTLHLVYIYVKIIIVKIKQSFSITALLIFETR